MGLFSYIEQRFLSIVSTTVSITGGGGKTTLLIGLGAYLRARGRSVLLTTSTKIQSPEILDFHADHIFRNREEAFAHAPKKGETVFYAETLDERKCTSPALEDIERLSKLYDVTLVEADGARFLPLKMHTDRDPVVVKGTSLTLALMGASALGRRIGDVCFGSEGDGLVDEAFLQSLIDSPEGVLKGFTGDGAIIVNQCDSYEYGAFRRLASPCEMIMASAREDRIYEIVRNGL